MTYRFAEEISGWIYQGEYAVYSFEPGEETMGELLNGDYFACVDRSNRLIGYFCKGDSARIPTKEQFDYTDDALDLGLGMKPEFCGKGLGYLFFKRGLEFMREAYGAERMRLTVACFNRRAISVYRQHGFHITTSVTHKNTLKEFYIMVNTPLPD